MSGHDQLPDDGRKRTHRQNEAAPPLAEGGEKAPGTPPPTRKDDSVQVGGEDRSFVGEGPAKPGPRSRGDEVDPSVSHGGAESDTDDPDAR